MLYRIEIPTGAIDGLNREFRSELHRKPATLSFWKNGQRITDFSEAGPDSVLLDIPPVIGDSLTIYYEAAL